MAFVLAILSISGALWSYLDSESLQRHYRRQVGSFRPSVWAAMMLVAWFIALPLYLVRRGEVVRRGVAAQGSLLPASKPLGRLTVLGLLGMAIGLALLGSGVCLLVVHRVAGLVPLIIGSAIVWLCYHAARTEDGRTTRDVVAIVACAVTLLAGCWIALDAYSDRSAREASRIRAAEDAKREEERARQALVAAEEKKERDRLAAEERRRELEEDEAHRAAVAAMEAHVMLEEVGRAGREREARDREVERERELARQRAEESDRVLQARRPSSDEAARAAAGIASRLAPPMPPEPSATAVVAPPATMQSTGPDSRSEPRHADAVVGWWRGMFAPAVQPIRDSVARLAANPRGGGEIAQACAALTSAMAALDEAGVQAPAEVAKGARAAVVGYRTVATACGTGRPAVVESAVKQLGSSLHALTLALEPYGLTP